MKLFNFIKVHKYQLVVICLFVLAALLIFTFFQSLKKDHTYDKAMMEIKLREENNKAIQQLRESYNQVIQQKDEQLMVKEIEDSLVKINTAVLDEKIRQLLIQKTDHEKYKAIDNLGSDALRDYFSKLPSHNDY